ncbi:hypothetical protein J4409_02760 [Candidatus Woesearchaeota archaeon]|nr:hypothetical protein [Candidatus Woesearchaeota archaeon]
MVKYYAFVVEDKCGYFIAYGEGDSSKRRKVLEEEGSHILSILKDNDNKFLKHKAESFLRDVVAGGSERLENKIT